MTSTDICTAYITTSLELTLKTIIALMGKMNNMFSQTRMDSTCGWSFSTVWILQKSGLHLP